jgi:hypothetical protein
VVICKVTKIVLVARFSGVVKVKLLPVGNPEPMLGKLMAGNPLMAPVEYVRTLPVVVRLLPFPLWSVHAVTVAPFVQPPVQVRPASALYHAAMPVVGKPQDAGGIPLGPLMAPEPARVVWGASANIMDEQSSATKSLFIAFPY